MPYPNLSRRTFLRLAGVTTGGTVLSAAWCSTFVNNSERAAEETNSSMGVPSQQLAPPNRLMKEGIWYETVAEPTHLDIARDMYGASAALRWAGEPLLRRDEDQQLIPALAESYSVGAAAYVDIVIRKNARWSDGVPITAEDVVFTFRHLASPELDNPWAWFFYDIKGIRSLKERTGDPSAVGVEAIAPNIVRIHSTSSSALHIPALLAYQAASLVPKHKAEQNPKHWADTATGFVSSGPMRLVTWERHQRLEWEVNPYYNGPSKPQMQRVVQTFCEPNTVWFNSWGSVIRTSIPLRDSD